MRSDKHKVNTKRLNFFFFLPIWVFVQLMQMQMCESQRVLSDYILSTTILFDQPVGFFYVFTFDENFDKLLSIIKQKHWHELSEVVAHFYFYDPRELGVETFQMTHNHPVLQLTHSLSTGRHASAADNIGATCSWTFLLVGTHYSLSYSWLKA